MTKVAITQNRASAQDKTAVTQPDSLRAVLRYIKQFHPKELIVSGGSGAGETDNIFRICGLMDIVDNEGAEFFDHNRPPFTEVLLQYATSKDVTGPQQSVVNSRVLRYETLITLNQLKVHETATVTLDLKNVAMSYPAADYYGHLPTSYWRLESFHAASRSIKANPVSLSSRRCKYLGDSTRISSIVGNT